MVNISGMREVNCHSPTQPQHELELGLIIGRKPHTPHTTSNFLGTSRQPRKLIFGMKHKEEEKWGAIK
jgi:hypothetical protein